MKPIIKWQTHTTEATAKVLGIELSVKSNGKGKFESTVYCSGMRPEKDHTFDTLDDGKAWCEQTLQRWINASFEPVGEPLSDTLVEKLEQEIESLENSFEQFAIVDDEIAMVHTATIAGLKMAINIVKQHEAESEVQDD